MDESGNEAYASKVRV